MTREEAINKLTECAKDKLWGCGEYSEALEMAIQALETWNNLFKSYEALTKEITESGDIKNATKRIDDWCIEQLRGIIGDYYADLIIKESEILKTLEQEPMRDATPEERESIDKYIKSISKPTGINVFDFYEDNEQEELDFVQPKKTIPCTIKIQEPSEIKFWELDENDDCISRKAVLSLLADHFDNVFDMVKELPSIAIPQDHDGCENCRYQDKDEYEMPCRECQQNYKDMWEKKPHLIEVDDMIYKCSECGCDDIVGKWNFCPNCGAKMD